MKTKIITVALFVNSFFTIHGQQSSGGLLLDEDVYKSIPLASTAAMGSLPNSKDLSSWFPVPGDQGQQSSCVAWAVGYGLKSYQEAVENKKKPTSNNSVFSPSYIYNQIKLGGCEGGSYIKSALDILKSEGVPRLYDFPYDSNNCSSRPNKNIKDKASRYKIAEWRRVSVQNELEVKSQLAASFPVVIMMEIDQGFMNLNYNQIYNNKSGARKGYHAMVVVGYDNSKSAYKVLNSWGTDWGTNGYCWISYSAFKSSVKEGYTAQDIIIINPDDIDDVNLDIIPDPFDLPDTKPIANKDFNVNLSAPNVIHNQWGVISNGNRVQGMNIIVPGSINNGLNLNGQLLVRFYNNDGSPLFANSLEPNYRDANGLCAAGTPIMPITTNSADLSKIILFIPYYALNFPPKGGAFFYNIKAKASFYVNNFEKASSPLTLFQMRY